MSGRQGPGGAGSGAGPDKWKVWAGASFAGLAVVLAVASWWASSPEAAKIPEAYFSTDDGATCFPGDGKQLPTFEHEGTQAVRAYVFKCKDGHTFVGYLERYSDKAKAALAAAKDRPLTAVELKALTEGREFKKPGKNEQWITLKPNELTMKNVVLRGKMGIKCADGSTPQAVEE